MDVQKDNSKSKYQGKRKIQAKRKHGGILYPKEEHIREIVITPAMLINALSYEMSFWNFNEFLVDFIYYYSVEKNSVVYPHTYKYDGSVIQHNISTFQKVEMDFTGIHKFFPKKFHWTPEMTKEMIFLEQYEESCFYVRTMIFCGVFGQIPPWVKTKELRYAVQKCIDDIIRGLPINRNTEKYRKYYNRLLGKYLESYQER